MRRMAVSCVAFWLVSALFLGIGGLSATPSAGEAESGFVGRIGDERRAAGLAGYVVAPDLVDVARRHAEEMRRQQRLHHNPRLGDDVQGWEGVGENVGVGPSVEEIHRMLMESRSHRDNILHGRFTEVGVGVVVDGPDLWVVQVFRRPQSAAAAPSEPPAEAPAGAPAEPPAASPSPESEPAPELAPTDRPTAAAVRSASGQRGRVTPPSTTPAPPTTLAAVGTTTIPAPPVAPAEPTTAPDVPGEPVAAVGDGPTIDTTPATTGVDARTADTAVRQVTAPVAVAATMLFGVVTALAVHVLGARLRSLGAVRRTRWEPALAR